MGWRNILKCCDNNLFLQYFLKNDICNYTNITDNSFKMKLQNIRFIATGIGLKNYSKLNKQIYDSYFGTSKEIIMKKILESVLKK